MEKYVEICGTPIEVKSIKDYKLVLRTARKGANSGNQFYGCSAFPKCHFIKNVE